MNSTTTKNIKMFAETPLVFQKRIKLPIK